MLQYPSVRVMLSASVSGNANAFPHPAQSTPRTTGKVSPRFLRIGPSSTLRSVSPPRHCTCRCRFVPCPMRHTHRANPDLLQNRERRLVAGSPALRSPWCRASGFAGLGQKPLPSSSFSTSTNSRQIQSQACEARRKKHKHSPTFKRNKYKQIAKGRSERIIWESHDLANSVVYTTKASLQITRGTALSAAVKSRLAETSFRLC